MTTFIDKTVLMDEQAMHRALVRIAHEILEKLCWLVFVPVVCPWLNG